MTRTIVLNDEAALAANARIMEQTTIEDLQRMVEAGLFMEVANGRIYSLISMEEGEQ